MEARPKASDISIIIVNRNTSDLLKNCLTSVLDAATTLAMEIWVVDNGSTDSSLEMLDELFPSVRVIANETNVGFARANNQALRLADGQCLLLLNSDTIVLPGALEELTRILDADPGIAAVGPQLLNPDGSVQPSCGHFPTLWDEFLFQSFLFKLIPSAFPYGRRVHPLQKQLYNRERDVDWITGAAFAIRAEVIQQIGLLDESLFMYGEDLDWCWRAKRAGHRIRFCPQARVIHHVGRSSHRDYATWVENYTRGTLTFYERHRSPFSLYITCVLIMIGCVVRVVISRTLMFLLTAKRVELWQRAKGYWRACFLAWHTLKACVFSRS